MPSSWQDLTDLVQGRAFLVERVRLTGSDMAIEGSFQLPPLAGLTMEDQVFVMAFLRSHGSIKQMEKLFGISYPTVKNRLRRIAAAFEFVEMGPVPDGETDGGKEVLDLLESGEITAGEAVERLKQS